MTKQCVRCKETKPVADFNHHKRSKDGFNSWCKHCTNENNKEWHKNHSAALKQKYRQQRALTPPKPRNPVHNFNKLCAWPRVRTCSKCKITKPAEYFYNCQKSYDGLMSICKACKRAFWKTEEGKNIKSQYRLKNLPYFREQSAIRKIREIEAEGFYTQDDLLRIFTAQHGLCVYCQTKLQDHFSVDHKTPISRGGNHWPENIQLLCVSCNKKKHTKTHEEYLLTLQSQRGDDFDKRCGTEVKRL